MTHSSPSSSARVVSPARSEPASGSVNPWHHEISPLRMPGMNWRFCSSVPHCRMVGPTRVSPKKSARNGAPARANSSFSTTCWRRLSPLPPYSAGQLAQIQPPAKSLAVHSSLKALRSPGVMEKPGLPPAVGQVLPEPPGDLDPEFLRFVRVGEVHGCTVPVAVGRVRPGHGPGRAAHGAAFAPDQGVRGGYAAMVERVGTSIA